MVLDVRSADEWAAWIPSFAQLIQLYFILITTIALITATLPPLRDSILTYGKLDSPSSPSTATAKGAASESTSAAHPGSVACRDAEVNHGWFIEVLRTLKVPKTWFSHFYIFATLWMIYLSVDLFFYTHASSSSSTSQWRSRPGPLQGPESESGSESTAASSPISSVLFSTYPSWSFLTLLNHLGVMPTHPCEYGTSFSQSSPPHANLSSPPWRWAPAPEILVAMACYLVHVLRRWFESWFVERPSPSGRMHLGHYLVGISFYAAMAPALWVDAYEFWIQETQQGQGQRQRRRQDAAGMGASMNWQCMFGLALFLWASWHQYRCHLILANLRKPLDNGSTPDAGAKPQEYKVPFGDWFEYLVTPHYSAEMMIYFAFYLMALSSESTISSSSPSSSLAPTLLVAWVWVVINLGVVARETSQWYRSRFGEGYAGMVTTPTGEQKRKKRAILVPFVY